VPEDSPLRREQAWSMLMVPMGALAYLALERVMGRPLKAANVIPHYEKGTWKYTFTII